MAELIKHLEMRNIVKRFPGVLACDNIDLKLESGEILALLGENGAGKTTLMNILYGLYQQDEGQVLVNHKEIHIDSPRKAFELGIGMVHQHFMLVPNLTVVENVALGMRNADVFKLDLPEIRQKIIEVSEKHDLAVHPDSYIWQLSVGEQQRVELIKTICLGANLLILDEPTAALTPQETDELIILLKKMAKQNCSIIFISHKLNEVKALSDRVCVLRQGQKVYEGMTAEHSAQTLATEMAGRDVHIHVSEEKENYGKIALEVKNVWAKNDKDNTALEGLSLSVREGEILGIAGVSGNGQKELAEVINGLRKVEKGKILLNNEEITNLSPQKVINKGMGYIPEDRMHEGTIPAFSIRENFIMKDYAEEPFSKKQFLKEKVISQNATNLIQKFDVKCPDMNTACGSLSGGNIQKVILAREIERSPKVLIAVYPIRGLDLGAAEFVHNQLLKARDNNMGVMMISEELDELLNMCDRIAVIYEGKIMDVLEKKDANKSKLGLLMAGVKENLNGGANEKKAI